MLAGAMAIRQHRPSRLPLPEATENHHNGWLGSIEKVIHRLEFLGLTIFLLYEVRTTK